VLQYFGACYKPLLCSRRVWQCDAVWCGVLQCVAVCCSVLQCGAVRCNMLQRVTRHLFAPAVYNASGAVCYGVLRCVAVCCGVVQCVAVLYIVL